MKKSLADKIVLPEFPDDIEFNSGGYMVDVDTTLNEFSLYVRICDDNGWVYGYISNTYLLDDAIVATDSHIIPYTQDCTPNKSECRKAYKKIVTELREEYKQWVMKNILFEE